MRNTLKLGRKSVVYFGGFLSVIGLAFLFTYVHPKLYPDKYSRYLIVCEYNSSQLIVSHDTYPY